MIEIERLNNGLKKLKNYEKIKIMIKLFDKN